jgi:hypothetical protein
VGHQQQEGSSNQGQPEVSQHQGKEVSMRFRMRLLVLVSVRTCQ